MPEGVEKQLSKQDLADIIRASIRTDDVFARMGGDEFAVLFVRADHRPARDRAREMLRGLGKLRIACKTHRISVRASLGLAAYTGETQIEHLIDRADRAMYADKKNGGRAARLTTLG